MPAPIAAYSYTAARSSDSLPLDPSSQTPVEGALPDELDAPFSAMVTQTGTPSVDGGGVAPIGEDAVNAEMQKFMPINKDTGDQTEVAIQQMIDDPTTPPDLKEAAKNLKMAMAGERPTLTDAQMGTVSVLQRHRDAFPLTADNIQQ